MDKKQILTEGSIPKKIILFAIPLFLGNLFQQLYNTADALIVGNALGETALAAVSSTGSLIFLIVGFFNGTAAGAGVVIARYFGAKDDENVSKAIHTNVTFGVITGILMTVIGVLFAPKILILMGTPTEVLFEATKYLQMYFMGSLCVTMYNVCTGILQAVGDSRSPLYYLIFSAFVNVILDLVFNWFLKLGVEYAALATVISQLLSVLLCIWKLRRMEGACKLEFSKIRMDFGMLRQILTVGLPSGLQNSIISIGNIVVQSNINSFGEMAMAGVGAYQKIEGFGFMPITCFAMAMTTFIGQNLGARKYERAKKGAIFGIASAAILAEIVGILIYTFGPFLIGLFNSNPQVNIYGVTFARMTTLFYCLLAFSHAAAGVLRGAGKSTIPMFVMMGSWCFFRITYVTLMVNHFHDIRVVFSAYPITWSISTIIFTIYLLKADWIHNFERQENK